MIDLVKNLYKNVEFNKVSKKDTIVIFQIKISSSDTKEMIETSLRAIQDLSVVGVEPMPSVISKMPRNLSTWIMFGSLTSLFIVSILTFTIPDNFIDNMSNSQLLMIQLIIAVIISVWIFFYDKKTQENIIDVLARLDLRTSEINENVKDLNNDV